MTKYAVTPLGHTLLIPEQRKAERRSIGAIGDHAVTLLMAANARIAGLEVELARARDRAAGLIDDAYDDVLNLNAAKRRIAEQEATLTTLNSYIDALEVYGAPDRPMSVTIAVRGHVRCESARTAIDAALAREALEGK